MSKKVGTFSISQNSITWAGFLIDYTDEHARTLKLTDDQLKNGSLQSSTPFEHAD